MHGKLTMHHWSIQHLAASYRRKYWSPRHNMSLCQWFLHWSRKWELFTGCLPFAWPPSLPSGASCELDWHFSIKSWKPRKLQNIYLVKICQNPWNPCASSTRHLAVRKSQPCQPVITTEIPWMPTSQDNDINDVNMKKKSTSGVEIVEWSNSYLSADLCWSSKFSHQKTLKTLMIAASGLSRSWTRQSCDYMWL